MSSRHAVVVVNTGASATFEAARPSVQHYCDRHGLAFVELTSPRFHFHAHATDYHWGNFEKFQAADCFDAYDRILRLDADILITPACPNVFAHVPEAEVGVVYEDRGGRAAKRQAQMARVVTTRGGAPWGSGRYFNSGVIVASRRHRALFELDADDRRAIERGDLGGCKEQNLINWKARALGIPLMGLDYRFNHMSMFSEAWNGWPHRLNAYLIHYAGSQARKGARLERDATRVMAAWAGRPLPLHLRLRARLARAPRSV